VERGADGIAGHLLQFAGNNGGDQEAGQFCTLRLDGTAMAPTSLASAVSVEPELPIPAGSAAKPPPHPDQGRQATIQQRTSAPGDTLSAISKRESQPTQRD
jgi:hypothetical protein